MSRVLGRQFDPVDFAAEAGRHHAARYFGVPHEHVRMTHLAEGTGGEFADPGATHEAHYSYHHADTGRHYEVHLGLHPGEERPPQIWGTKEVYPGGSSAMEPSRMIRDRAWSQDPKYKSRRGTIKLPSGEWSS